jgi:hypothetical protein
MKQTMDFDIQLDSFDLTQRKQALQTLTAKVARGEISLPKPGGEVNLHCHTFFSYNCYGYSPTHYAWRARSQGLAVGGIVDFDVLDGLEEFLEASRLLGLKACVGIESRVFVPEFADREMSSPGEPGITYHMGVGFPRYPTSDNARRFLGRLKSIAQQRNQQLIERVNPYLAPATIDYKSDLLPLSPGGNPTERHICLAYARKAAKLFPDPGQLKKFWAEKLKVPTDKLDPPEGRELTNSIRAKTMKQGGVGYVVPDQGSFPRMAEVNRFVLENGGIPTVAWLNGFSAGEQAIDELLRVAMSTGVAAINIIPDRNYTPGVADEKLANLNHIVEVARRLKLPIFVGTEMNSPGQKFVDSFETKELAALLPDFLKGAHIAYAHTVLSQNAAIGYCSEWAAKHFRDGAAKNDFYETVGRLLPPDQADRLADITINSTPRDILTKIQP